MPRKIPKPVQQFRGTTAQHATYTGPEGEITVDTTKHTAVVHDGQTAGGFPLMLEQDIVNSVQLVSSVASGSSVIFTPTIGVIGGNGDLVSLALRLEGQVNTPIERTVSVSSAGGVSKIRIMYRSEMQEKAVTSGVEESMSFLDGTTCAVTLESNAGGTGKHNITFVFTFAVNPGAPFLKVTGLADGQSYVTSDALLSQDLMNALTAGTDGKIMLDGSGLDKSYLPLYFPFESGEIVPEIHTFFPDHCRVILVDGLQSDGTSVDALGITVQLDGDSAGTSAVTLKNGQIDSDGAFAGKAVVIRCSGRTTETWVSALLRLTPTMLASDL